MKFLVTALHQDWRRLRTLDAVPAEAGSGHRGVVALVDWDTKAILAQASYDSPSGAYLDENELWLCSCAGHHIRVFDNHLQFVRLHIHRLFNDLHTVTPGARGVLVTASGTDAILEVTSDQGIGWTWLATQHGYDRLLSGGIRRVAAHKDWSQFAVGTMEETTHINSAAVFDDRTVLATLFAQGELIKIDRLTGRADVMLRGLDRPHRIQRIRGSGSGWTVCDSATSRVILLDESLNIVREIYGGFNWVQDAVALNGIMFVLDANNCRIVEYDLARNRCTAEFLYPEKWKGFGLLPVPTQWEEPLLAINEWGETYVG